ncbi:uncharacterized protein XM38_024840 [Halomicronema hongdechloris C2206]|uniref:DUF4278 domain-containing protein n=1 Tax=Halomicronema hongdechloris C2206 TaxID=1641165 RepID=A0A1Z3HMJ1_9CYAN|nr:DUF4278 domain-containing protein [Halomicronema hongdechloris]ASC71532.1 uncharacterized protein XM38_024840 [Halomicronema hongdechloris C2206]
MHLRYRGVDYETETQNLDMTEEVIGRYRGAVVKRHVAKNAPAQGRASGLVYRGARVK